MNIAENISEILKKIPNNVKLIAVSKTKPNELIMEAYNLGYKIFGENKIQELTQKYNDLPKDIQWHMIGHLQTNKVKYIAPFINLIHAVNSIKLIKEINKQALKNNRIIDCLLQFHIAQEKSKFGFDFDEVKKILQTDKLKKLDNINIVGVMGMATFTNDKEQIRQEFRYLKSIFDYLKKEFFPIKNDFKEISMGMSGDYDIAIEEGSTMIRVGSSIFGTRG